MSSDVARRLARGAIYPCIEAAFGAVAAAGGARSRCPPRRPWSGGGLRVVIVAPHPDDETIGAGGAAALHVGAGDHVTIAVVTDGGASRAGGLRRDEMIRRRADELRTAVAALGVTQLVSLGLPEGAWDAADAASLDTVLAPADVVYAPSCIDYHPEHVAVAAVVAERAPARGLVRIYGVGVPLTPLLVNCVADTTAVAAQTQQAIAAYRTQTDALHALARRARYQARFHALTAAEEFWEVSAPAYARIMQTGDWRHRRDGRSPFRGLRSRPLSDPLSYAAGWIERRRLLRVAHDA